MIRGGGGVAARGGGCCEPREATTEGHMGAFVQFDCAKPTSIFFHHMNVGDPKIRMLNNYVRFD